MNDNLILKAINCLHLETKFKGKNDKGEEAGVYTARSYNRVFVISIHENPLFNTTLGISHFGKKSKKIEEKLNENIEILKERGFKEVSTK